MEGASDGFRNQLLDEDALYDRLAPLSPSEEHVTLYDHLQSQETPVAVTRLSVAQGVSSPVGYVLAAPHQTISDATPEPQWQYSAIAQSVDSVLASQPESVHVSSPSAKSRAFFSAASSPTKERASVNPSFADFAAANAAGGALSARVAVRGDHASPDPQLPPNRTVSSDSDRNWRMSSGERQRYEQQFHTLSTSGGFLSGVAARDFFLKSKLPNTELSAIWKLSDVDGDGQLSMDEFCIAVHIVIHRRKGAEIPTVLPAVLHPKKDQFDIESAFDELKSTKAPQAQELSQLSVQAFQPVLSRRDSGGNQLTPGQGTAMNSTTVIERKDQHAGLRPGQPPMQHVIVGSSAPLVQQHGNISKRQTEPIIRPQPIKQRQQTAGNLSQEANPLVLANPMVRMPSPPHLPVEKPPNTVPSSALLNTSDGNSSIHFISSPDSRDSTSPENDGFPLVPPSLPQKKKVSQSSGIGRHPESSGRVLTAMPSSIDETDSSEPPPPIEKPSDLLSSDKAKQVVMELLAPPSVPPKKKSSSVRRSKSQRDRPAAASSKVKRRASKEAAGYSQLDDDACSLGDTPVDSLPDSHSPQQQIVHDLVKVPLVINLPQLANRETQASIQTPKSPKIERVRSASLDLDAVQQGGETDGTKTEVHPFKDLPPTPPPKDPPAVPPKRKPRKHAPEPPADSVAKSSSDAFVQGGSSTRKGHKKSASLDILSSSPDLRDLTRHIRSMTPDSSQTMWTASTDIPKPVTLREKKKAPPIPPAPYGKGDHSDVSSSEPTSPKDPYASVNKVKKDKSALEEEIKQLKNRCLALKRLNSDLHTRLIELKEERCSLQVEKERLRGSQGDIQQQ